MKEPIITPEEKKVSDFINGEVTYDKDGQYFWINDGQMLAELRGWGAIQNMKEFKVGRTIDEKEAGKYQDRIGEWIAQAINEKLEREQSEGKRVLAILAELRKHRDAYEHGSKERMEYNGVCDKLDCLASHLLNGF